MKRKRRPVQPTLKTITPQHLYALVHTFCQLHPTPKTRGRPPLYPEELILTLALLLTRMNTSYRDLLFCHAPHAFPDLPLPALGTLVYRFRQLVERHADRLHPLLAWLAQLGMALETPTAETPYAMVDGTGVGYAVPFCGGQGNFTNTLPYPLTRGDRWGIIPPACRAYNALQNHPI